MVFDMDSVSQALFGGLSASACSRNTNLRQTFFYGAVGGTLPDLDAWIGALFGPLQERLWHRGPSHSFFVLGLLGLAVVLSRRKLPDRFYGVLLSVWVGTFTHPLLDVLTGFETAWGYPFFNPSSLGWFPVLEPVLLILLIVASLGLLYFRHWWCAPGGLALLFLWFLIVGGVHWNVSTQVKESRALGGERVLVRPMLASFLTYRVLWVTPERCEIAAYQPFGDQPSWSRLQGNVRVKPSSDIPALPAALLNAGCFVETADGALGDLRFALTPDSAEPLWLWRHGTEGWTREARRKMNEERKTHFFSLWRGDRPADWTSELREVED